MPIESTDPLFITKALHTLLTEVFPNRCPALSESDREIWRNAGASMVVAWLAEYVQEDATAALLEASLTSSSQPAQDSIEATLMAGAGGSLFGVLDI